MKRIGRLTKHKIKGRIGRLIQFRLWEKKYGCMAKTKIRSKIKNKNNEVIVNGLVNSGYETESLEILVDSKIAKELGYYPKFPEETSIAIYTMAGSTEIKLIHIKTL